MTGYDVRVAWAAGGSDGVTERITGVGPKLLDEVWTGPGMEVLDVATGSGGSIAIPAAMRGATVTGVDLDPQHFETGRQRAAAAGVTIGWIEGDAAELPFEDGRFDRAFSTFGHMFAPDQERAGAELIRVCKPGGTIGLATWTPDGYAGRLFEVIGRHLPPGGNSPARWGDPDEVRRLLPGLELAFQTDHVVFRSPTVETFAAFYEDKFGPLAMARQALGDEWPALRDEVRAFDADWNIATDGSLRIEAGYLVTIGVKPR